MERTTHSSAELFHTARCSDTGARAVKQPHRWDAWLVSRRKLCTHLHCLFHIPALFIWWASLARRNTVVHWLSPRDHSSCHRCCVERRTQGTVQLRISSSLALLGPPAIMCCRPSNSDIKRKLFWRHKKSKEQSICHADRHLSSQKRGVRTKEPKVQRTSRAPRWHCERRLRLLCCIHRARFVCVSNDSCKTNGCHCKTTWLCRTKQRMQYLLIHRKKGRCFQKILKNPKSECPDIWIRLKRPKSWSSMEDPVVPLERNPYGHPLAGLLWERQFEQVLLQHGWEKSSKLGTLVRYREKGLFLSVYVDDTKLAGKKQNMNFMSKILMKDVDLGEPTSFLDHVYLGCTQREWQIRNDIVDNYKSMFESRISAGVVDKYQKRESQGNLVPKRYLHGPMTWKVMQRNAWKAIENWRIKNPIIIQSRDAMSWRQPVQRKRNGICWIIV